MKISERRQRRRREGSPQQFEYVDKVSRTPYTFSDNPKIGLNYQEFNARIQKCFKDKIMVDTLRKTVSKTLLKREVVEEGQFELGNAIKQAERVAKNYTDKIQVILEQSLVYHPTMLAFEQYKLDKLEKRERKVESIMNLVSKIADKLREKKVEEILENFKKEMERSRVVIPENNEYERCKVRIPALMERVRATREAVLRGKELEGDSNFF